MSATPYQTYLAERLQSARWLGWEMPETRPLPKSDSHEAGWTAFALPNLLAAWLSVIA